MYIQLNHSPRELVSVTSRGDAALHDSVSCQQSARCRGLWRPFRRASWARPWRQKRSRPCKCGLPRLDRECIRRNVHAVLRFLSRALYGNTVHGMSWRTWPAGAMSWLVHIVMRRPKVAQGGGAKDPNAGVHRYNISLNLNGGLPTHTHILPTPAPWGFQFACKAGLKAFIYKERTVLTV